jgi:hypothetical protein
LWKWNFPDDPAISPQTAIATRMDAHQDWLALAAGSGGIISLAADGSLWHWRFPLQRFQPGALTLLGPSRKPRLIGNIFAKPN